MRRAIAVLILGTGVSAAAGAGERSPIVVEVAGVTVECRDLAVVGAKDGQEIWTIRHPSLERMGDGSRVIGPTAAGGRLYYGVGSHLLVVDPVAGRVTRRVIFSERITGIRPAGTGVVVTVQRRWGEHTPESEYAIEPGGPDPPLFLPGSLLLAVSPMRDVDGVSGEFGPAKRFRGTGKPKPAEEAIPALTEQAERDPTNPFWQVELGERLIDLGRKDEARAAFEQALAVEGSARILLLLASNIIEEHGFTDIAERAFESGYRVYLESGHEPELFSGLIGLMIHFGSTHGPVSSAIETGDFDRADKVMERIWKLAPLVEASAFAYAGMARESRKAGRTESAEKWEKRAEAAKKYGACFARLDGYADRAGQGLNFLGASILALVLYFAYLVSKYWPVQWKDIREGGGFLASFKSLKGLRTNFVLSYAPRAELLALLILCASAVVAGLITVPGIRAIANGASMDPAALSGSWGAPEAAAWLEGFAGHDEGKELYGLGLVQAGKLGEAEAILKTLTRSPEAQNNLGVALSRQRREEDARAAFEAALALDPDLPEASFNLGREAAGVRVERARKYLPGRKLLAMPALDTWGRAMVKGEGKGTFVGIVGDVLSVFDMQRALVGRSAGGSILLWVLIAIVGLFSLVLLFLPPPEARARPYGAHWWLSLATPGVHSRYAPFGIAALVGYIYCGFVLSAHAGLPGAASVLDAIAMPSVMGAFGVEAGLGSTWRGGLITLSWVAVFAVPLLSALGVILLRFLRPEEPHGESSGFTWQAVRAAIFLAGGVLLVVFFEGLSVRIPGLLLVLCGVASFLLALKARRGGPPAEPQHTSEEGS